MIVSVLNGSAITSRIVPSCCANRRDTLGAEIIGLQHGAELRLVGEVCTSHQGKFARHGERLREMLFIHEAELQQEQVHALGRVLRHRERARVLLRRQQAVGDQPCDRVRNLFIAL